MEHVPDDLARHLIMNSPQDSWDPEDLELWRISSLDSAIRIHASSGANACCRWQVEALTIGSPLPMRDRRHQGAGRRGHIVIFPPRELAALSACVDVSGCRDCKSLEQGYVKRRRSSCRIRQASLSSKFPVCACLPSSFALGPATPVLLAGSIESSKPERFGEADG